MHQAHTQILLGVRHADVPWLAGVCENMMTTPYTTQIPAIRFKLLDELLAVHGGYDNHHANKVNTITVVVEAIRIFSN